MICMYIRLIILHFMRFIEGLLTLGVSYSTNVFKVILSLLFFLILVN